MRKTGKKILGALLATSMVMSMAGCGSNASTANAINGKATADGSDDSAIAADSPYAGKGFNFSTKETIVMYALGDRPADMDAVLEKANSEYFEPNLNTTLDVQFLNWSDYQTKYSLLLSGGEQVDLIYTASWCYYNDEVAAGAFKKLDEDYLKTYMPYTYEELPEEAWKEIAINGDIYAVPKGKATFTSYNGAVVRQDLIDKYSLTTPDSWDNFKKYLEELAELQSETGVTALNTDANREQLFTLFCQENTLQGVTEGYDFLYQANNSEKAPNPEDIQYSYMSDFYTDYALQMADLASKGVWSSNAINDTTDAQTYFENGTSGALVWNSSILTAGDNLEKAGLGEYKVYDVTPNTKRSRGAYSVDATAIASKAADPERAALVLDYMKSDVDLNRLLLGGIEGTHYELDEDGNRITLDKASDYPWNGWAWNINRQDEPDEAGMDERAIEYGNKCEEMEFVPEQTGFTFDPSPVQNQYAAVQSVVSEYQQSFALGIYGKDTESAIDEFHEALKAAGVEEFTAEFIKQYTEYKEANNL
ncbi:MAG: ABC transporter substrate-binding protein [Pseudobutyrivibrio sp.]|nr:ABC transporter substrate-binding protein [Pseudobutyrivibrio sp.]